MHSGRCIDRSVIFELMIYDERNINKNSYLVAGSYCLVILFFVIRHNVDVCVCVYESIFLHTMGQDNFMYVKNISLFN